MLNEVIRYFVTNIVDKPELLEIKMVEVAGKNIIEVRVAPTDLAKVIGKEGRTFKALRSLVHAIEPNANKDIVVDIVAQ